MFFNSSCSKHQNKIAKNRLIFSMFLSNDHTNLIARGSFKKGYTKASLCIHKSCKPCILHCWHTNSGKNRNFFQKRILSSLIFYNFFVKNCNKLVQTFHTRRQAKISIQNQKNFIQISLIIENITRSGGSLFKNCSKSLRVNNFLLHLHISILLCNNKAQIISRIHNLTSSTFKKTNKPLQKCIRNLFKFSIIQILKSLKIKFLFFNIFFFFFCFISVLFLFHFNTSQKVHKIFSV